MNLKLSISILVIVMLVVLILAPSHLQIVFWNIPENFHGWAVVHFADESCKTSQTHKLWMSVSIDPAGRGCVPSPFPRGWVINRYAYVRQDGSKVSLSSASPGSTVLPLSYNPSRKTYVVFIGTEAERDKSWQSEPKPL